MSAVSLTHNKLKRWLSHADICCCSVGLPDIAYPTGSLLHAHHQQATMLYTHCVWALAVREHEEVNGGFPGTAAPCSAVT